MSRSGSYTTRQLQGFLENVLDDVNVLDRPMLNNDGEAPVIRMNNSPNSPTDVEMNPAIPINYSPQYQPSPNYDRPYLSPGSNEYPPGLDPRLGTVVTPLPPSQFNPVIEVFPVIETKAQPPAAFLPPPRLPVENKSPVRHASNAGNMESGSNICGYNLRRSVGEGGYGSVYLVQDQQGRPSVMKIFGDGGTTYLEMVAGSVCRHPNILTIENLLIFENTIQVDNSKGIVKSCPRQSTKQNIALTFPLAMLDLNKQLRRNNPNVVPDLARQLATGLAYLHENGILHLVLKPHNVLLFPSARGAEYRNLKIADFGLCAFYDIYDRGARNNHPAITDNYAPREALQNRRFDTSHYYFPSMDIWSLGVILLQMFANNYENIYEFSRLNSKRPEIYTPDFIAAQVNREYPYWRELVALIQDCLNFNSQKRPTAVTVMRTLEKIIGYTAEPLGELYTAPYRRLVYTDVITEKMTKEYLMYIQAAALHNEGFTGTLFNAIDLFFRTIVDFLQHYYRGGTFTEYLRACYSLSHYLLADDYSSNPNMWRKRGPLVEMEITILRITEGCLFRNSVYHRVADLAGLYKVYQQILQNPLVYYELDDSLPNGVNHNPKFINVKYFLEELPTQLLVRSIEEVKI